MCDFCGASDEKGLPQPDGKPVFALVNVDGDTYCSYCLKMAMPREWTYLGGDTGAMVGAYRLLTKVVA